jgi:trimethylamine---corrinoid protein Co-methyltransferase
MNDTRRSGGRRLRAERSSGGIPQLPWRTVENPFAPLELARPEQIEALHRTSIRILWELGIRVMSDRVMDLFAGAGAIVDRAEKMIRLDEAIVEAALRTAPRQFTLVSRNPARRLEFGGRHVVFGLVAGPPNVHDRVNGRRAGNLRD